VAAFCAVGVGFRVRLCRLPTLFPYLVVDRITIWQAAAARESLMFVFVGACVVLPVIVVYTVFSYRVFWGKARSLTYGE